MKLFVAGDFSPRLRVAESIRQNGGDELFKDFKQVILESDYSIVNFECAVGEPQWKIPKIGSILPCNENIVHFLHNIGFKAVSLANNHFFDLGQKGVECSIKLFNECGLDYVGGGVNRQESSKILIKRMNDTSIAIINACEREFSISDDNHGGSNPIDIINISTSIKQAKSQVEHVIVILHSGIEHWQLPTPEMQKKYRFFIDCGADIIINHHQHCYSGFETYNGKYIFYGLGNFCFDIRKAAPTWFEGFALMLDINNGTISPQMIPYKQNCEIPGVHLMSDTSQFEQKINQLNRIIQDPDKLQAEFDKYVKSRKPLINFTPYGNRILRSLYLRNLFPSFLSKKRHVELLNFTRCESHYEVLQRYLYLYYNKNICNEK